MFVEIKDIEFDSFNESNENANYPESGFYMVKAESHNDLRFVDKNLKTPFFICHKSVFDGIKVHINNPEAITPTELDNTTPPASYVSESFVMDFTKLLLGKK
ncbi:hypothetical protein CMU84_16385 [Elizabethkingia anophelis]|uniref:hypothetical protein n=1 Tax=Elizabethkingia miricola TaxID=172045 RepID=UPI000B34FB63|nr:hypothetical protein [Elizabethkingia miricola]MDV3636729.1 hypothetical protein [Elizabethkingia anophelis]MDV3734250.1 hypothetical protein [Elizabethkingia anophelis]